MGGNNLSVKITADVVDMQQKFAVARAEASALSSEMNKLAKESAGGGQIDSSKFAQLAQGYLQAKTAAAGYGAEIRQSMDANKGLGDSVDEARAKMSTMWQVTGAAAAYEAVSKLVEIVTEYGNRALEIRNMSDILGVTTGQFQAMAAAADEAGISDQILVRANERLVTTIAEARDGSGPAIIKLKELGLATDQASLKAMDLNTALGVIGPRLQDSSTHAAEMAAATRLLGGRAALAAEAWKQYDGSAAGVVATNARLNALTEEQIKDLADNAIAVKEFGAAAANTGSKVLLFAEDMAKLEAKVAAAVSSLMPQAVAMRAAMAMMSTPATTSANPAAAQIAQTQQVTQEVIVSAKRMTAATLESENDQVQAAAAGSAQRVALARQYYEDTRGFYQNDSVAAVRSAYREMTSAEQAFNAEHLANLRAQAADAKEKDRDDVASYREALAQMKEADKEFQSIDKQNAAADIAIARSTLEAKKAVLESEVGANAQAAAAKFSALRDLVNQEYALDEQALQNELKGLEDQPAAYNRVYNEIRTLKAKNVQDLAALDEQAAAAARRSAQQDSAGWRDSVKEIESAEGTLLSDLISKRRSLGASLVQVTASFAQQEIANDVKAMTTRMLLTQTEQNSQKALEQGGLLYHLLFDNQKTAATVSGATARTSAMSAAAGTQTSVTASAAAAQQGIAAATGASTVMGDAAKAFAGTYASVAQIPYVGWVMAPGAAAAAFAEVASMAGMASLDVGAWNVPHDMVAQIHAGESVVPTTFAEGMRQNGGFSGAEQGAGGDIHIHNHITAWDHSSVEGMVKSPAFRQTMIDAAKMHFSRGGR